MSEASWFLYQNSEQIGPFEQGQILQMASNHMIAQDAYLFKVGWKDWVPYENCAGELGLETAHTVNAPDQVRATRAPRASVTGQIIVHNNGDLVIGQGVNISATGIFVETPTQLFAVGEFLNITCRIDRLEKAFNAKAEVMRYDSHPSAPDGYGLRFVTLEPDLFRKVQALIDADNEMDSG